MTEKIQEQSRKIIDKAEAEMIDALGGNKDIAIMILEKVKAKFDNEEMDISEQMVDAMLAAGGGFIKESREEIRKKLASMLRRKGSLLTSQMIVLLGNTSDEIIADLIELGASKTKACTCKKV